MATVLANNSFLKNGFYNAVGGVVRIGLAVLTIPVLIRILGVEEYGLWTLASAVMSMVGLAEGGLSIATTVFVSKDLATEDTDGLSQTLTITFGAMLILATLAAIALWFGAESIVSFFPKLGQSQQLAAVQALKMGSLAVWARLLQQVLIGVEQAYQRYGLLNILNTMQWMLISLGLFAVAWRGGRTAALMQWQALTSVAVLLSHILVMRSLLRSVNLRLTWNKEKGLALGRYSLMTWLTSLGSALFSRVDRLIVAGLLGTQLLGVYAAIIDITAQINSFSALPVQPLLPSLSNLIAHQNFGQAKLEQQVKQAVQINALVALGLGTTLITLSPLILTLVMSSKTVDLYVLPFCIATSIYALSSINAVGYYVLLGANAVKTCTAIVVASGALSLIMIAIGAYSFGLVGAVCGNSGFLGSLLLVFYGNKHLSIPKHQWIKWLILPISMFLCFTLLSIFIPNQNILLRLKLAGLQNLILLVCMTIHYYQKGFKG